MWLNVILSGQSLGVVCRFLLWKEYHNLILTALFQTYCVSVLVWMILTVLFQTHCVSVLVWMILTVLFQTHCVSVLVWMILTVLFQTHCVSVLVWIFILSTELASTHKLKLLTAAICRDDTCISG